MLAGTGFQYHCGVAPPLTHVVAQDAYSIERDPTLETTLTARK